MHKISKWIFVHPCLWKSPLPDAWRQSHCSCCNRLGIASCPSCRKWSTRSPSWCLPGPAWRSNPSNSLKVETLNFSDFKIFLANDIFAFQIRHLFVEDFEIKWTSMHSPWNLSTKNWLLFEEKHVFKCIKSWLARMASNLEMPRTKQIESRMFDLPEPFRPENKKANPSANKKMRTISYCNLLQVVTF